MNIEEMIWNGASEEDIAAALKSIYKEKERQEKALRKKTQEDLKREGRVYIINALLAYGEAFELLNPVEIEPEDIKELEAAIVNAEKEIPKYIKMFEMLGMDLKGLFKEE